jgi:outer membrane lipase/esterase
MFRSRHFNFVTFIFLAFASQLAQALPYSSLVVFGDSLADSGNNAIALGPNRTPTPIASPDFIPTLPYALNRYSNGPVWVEQFAIKLGLNAAPSLLGGTNYAFGGAETGPAGSPFPFSLTDQVEMYLGGGAADSNALFVVAGGGNDARAAIATAAGGGDPTAIINAYVQNVAAILTRLSNAGAQNILFVNVPNVGLTPALQAADIVIPGAAAGASAISAEMNLGASSVFAGLLPTLSADINLFDFYSLVTNAVANPGAYGLTDGTTACAAVLACIANPDSTLFWDGIHPTTAGHARIAQAVFATVIPEPSSLALVLVVGFIFAWRSDNERRRRRL